MKKTVLLSILVVAVLFAVEVLAEARLAWIQSYGTWTMSFRM